MFALAGMELILFTVATVGVYFGFLLKTVSIITGMLSLLLTRPDSVKTFSAPHATSPVSEQGVHKVLGRDRARTAEQNLLKGYITPYDITFSI